MKLKSGMAIKWYPLFTVPMTDAERKSANDPIDTNRCLTPDSGQRVWITINKNGKLSTHEARFYDTKYSGKYFSCLTATSHNQDIVAWMPYEIPEPYRKEKVDA